VPVSGSARAAVARRCGERCESCGLEWPWALHVFRVDPAGPARAGNPVALCLPCSAGRDEPGTPLLAKRGLRERVLAANNRRTGAKPLTAARRRALIAARGGRCEVCATAAAERQLDVHHKTGILRGGDDSEANLMVLCFACHHHLRPCASGCGGWAKRPAELCRRCHALARLAELEPGLSALELARRYHLRPPPESNPI
jgi:HNH endonuclease